MNDVLIIEIKLLETIPRDAARVIALYMRKRFEQQHELEIDLRYYQKMLSKHIDLVDRRIMKGEKIPHSERSGNVKMSK